MRRECQTAECRSNFEMYVKKSPKYILLMGDGRICKIAEHTFSLTSKILQQSPERSVGFYSLCNQKLLGVSWDFVLKKKCMYFPRTMWVYNIMVINATFPLSLVS